MNKGPDCGKKLATRLRCKQVICNFAILWNCSGKWDSPSNNSIVCLLPPWIDFLLIITLLLPAGVCTHIDTKSNPCTHAQPLPQSRYLLKAQKGPSGVENGPLVAFLLSSYMPDIAAITHTKKADIHSKAYNNDRILHTCLDEKIRKETVQ